MLDSGSNLKTQVGTNEDVKLFGENTRRKQDNFLEKPRALTAAFPVRISGFVLGMRSETGKKGKEDLLGVERNMVGHWVGWGCKTKLRVKTTRSGNSVSHMLFWLTFQPLFIPSDLPRGGIITGLHCLF